MQGGKWWLSQVSDREGSAEFEKGSGVVAFKSECGRVARKGCFEMQIRMGAKPGRTLRCRFAVAPPKLAQSRVGVIPEADGQPLRFRPG
jgi:hypothetical protein